MILWHRWINETHLEGELWNQTPRSLQVLCSFRRTSRFLFFNTRLEIWNYIKLKKKRQNSLARITARGNLVDGFHPISGSRWFAQLIRNLIWNPSFAFAGQCVCHCSIWKSLNPVWRSLAGFMESEGFRLQTFEIRRSKIIEPLLSRAQLSWLLHFSAASQLNKL